MESKHFSGYMEGGNIYEEGQAKVIAVTPGKVEKMIALIQNPRFAYSRQTNYGIAIYHHDPESPTGVINAGGIPNEFEFLLYRLGRTGQLSPTEDLRSAH